MRKNKDFTNLFIFYISFLWFSSYGSAVIPTHLLSQGLTIWDLIVGRVISYLVPVLLLTYVRRFGSKILWILATILYFASFLLSIKVLNLAQYYLASALFGSVIFLFWVPYNIAHYKLTPKAKTSRSSALLYGTISVISIIAPIIAGYLKKINSGVLWISLGFFFLITFFLATGQKNTLTENNTIETFKKGRGTRLFLILQGIWETVPFVIVPFYTLFFIKTPLEYGIYLSYLSLIGIIANLVLGKISDRLQKRSVFIYPLTIVMVINTLFLAFALDSAAIWIIATGMLQIFIPLFWNITLSMVVDYHQDITSAMAGRELILNVGRLVGTVAIALSFLSEKRPYFIFYFLAIVMLLYPLNLYWRTQIKKSHTYL